MTNKHPHTDRILRVIDYIHAHADEDLSLDQLADVAAFSRFHWHRVFAAIMGAPPAPSATYSARRRVCPEPVQ